MIRLNNNFLFSDEKYSPFCLALACGERGYIFNTSSWTDAQGVQHTSSIADPATDPRHIVALLREIFINKKVPGIKKVGYSSANVELPDDGVVCYTITDAALDSKSWPGHSVNDRFQSNNAIRTIYDIPRPSRPRMLMAT